jgi:hypothetical protein
VPPGLESAQIVGVDGGATSARACRACRVPGGLRALADGPARVHATVPGFVPVLREAAASALPLQEHQAARAWVASVADAVVDVLDRGPLLLGVAMPGLKTADGRGLAWLRHGPRAARFLDLVFERLAPRVADWLAPPLGLYSDAVAALEGERAAEGGLLAGLHGAWYLGGGTGLAEAALVDGRAVALDDSRLGWPRAWELDAGAGASFEQRLSMGALIERCGGFPEAAAGDGRVRAVLGAAARDLARLVELRARAWREARLGELERVVVGQRLGALLCDPRGADFAAALGRELEARDLPGRGWLVASPHSARAALGAASLALADFEARDAGS